MSIPNSKDNTSNKSNQKRQRFNWNAPELIGNRKKNQELLSKNGWICVGIKVSYADNNLKFLNEKGWFISGHGEIWLPQLPRINDCITLTIMNTHVLNERGVDSEYEEFVTARVNKIEMQSVSADIDFDQVEQYFDCLVYNIEVSIIEIPKSSDLDFN